MSFPEPVNGAPRTCEFPTVGSPRKPKDEQGAKCTRAASTAIESCSYMLVPSLAGVQADVITSPSEKANPLFTEAQRARLSAGLRGHEIDGNYSIFENLCFFNPEVAMELIDQVPQVLEPGRHAQYHLLETLFFVAHCSAYSQDLVDKPTQWK